MTASGIEADVIARPTHNLSLRASVANALGKYVTYPNGPCPIEKIGTSIAVCDLSGRPLSGLPKWVFTLGADYTRPASLFRATGEAYVHVDAYSRSDSYGDPTDSAYTVIEGYTVVNANVGFLAARNWDLFLFVRNVFDADYMQNLTIQAGNSGLIVGPPGDPRSFGVTLRLRQ